MTDSDSRSAPDASTPAAPDRVRPVDLRDYVQFSSDEPRRIRVHATDALALDLWCLEPRQSTRAIRLDQDVTYTIIGGRSWFVTEEGEVGLDPLGSILVPATMAHGFENRSADPLIVVASQASPGDEPVAEPVADEATAVMPEPSPGLLRRVADGLLGGRQRD